MKIVINAFSARLGGGQTYLINLLRYLPKEKEFEILIYAPDSLELPSDARIIRLHTKWPTNNPIMRSIWEKLVLPGKLKKMRATLLFCPGGVLGTKPPESCKTVTMFRNMMPFDLEAKKRITNNLQRIRNWILERVMLKSMENADLVIFISDYARSVIEKRIKTKKAVTISHGISAHFRTYKLPPPKAEFIVDGDYILYVSRFDVYKHHYEVVKAYSSLPKEIIGKFRLILIGESDTICGEKVKEFIAEKKLEERVKILGAVKYQLLPAAYHHAKLILFASSCENCPNILLEALGAGRPILSSSIMPMPEFGGDAVAYCDPRIVEDIASQMISILIDQQKIADLGVRAGLQSEKYSWEDTAKKTWDSILSL